MSVPNYFIQRADPTDPCSALEFFPPKGSDELHIALMQSYPHLKNLQSRMRQAVIEFHLGEQQQDEFDATNTPAISNQTTPEYLPSPISSFASTMGTPLTTQNQFTPSAAGPSRSLPSQEQLMTVWSLPSTQAKVHKRRNMTDAEKIAYKAKRIEGACSDCKRRRRRCDHNSNSTSPTSLPASRRRQSKQDKRASSSRSVPTSSQTPIVNETISFHKVEPPIADQETFSPHFDDIFDMTIDPSLTLSQSPLEYNESDFNYSAGFDFSTDFELFPDFPQALDQGQTWNHQPWQNAEGDGLYQSVNAPSLDWYPHTPHQNRFQTAEHLIAVMDSSESSPSSSISPQYVQPHTDQSLIGVSQESGRHTAGHDYLQTPDQNHFGNSEGPSISALPSRTQTRPGLLEPTERMRHKPTPELSSLTSHSHPVFSGVIPSPTSSPEAWSSRNTPRVNSRSSPVAVISQITAAGDASVFSPAASTVQRTSELSNQHAMTRIRSSQLPGLGVSKSTGSDAVIQSPSFTPASTARASIRLDTAARPQSSASPTLISPNRKTDRTDHRADLPSTLAPQLQLQPKTADRSQTSYLSESSETNRPHSSGHFATASEIVSRLRIVSRLCSMFPSSVSEVSELSRPVTFLGLSQVTEKSALSASRVAAMSMLWALCCVMLSCAMTVSGSFATVATCAAQVGIIWSLSSPICSSSLRSYLNPVTTLSLGYLGIAA